jgi:hypothetical protein
MTSKRAIPLAVLACGALSALVPALPSSAGTIPDPGTFYCQTRGFRPECRPAEPGETSGAEAPKQQKRDESSDPIAPRCGVAPVVVTDDYRLLDDLVVSPTAW